MKEPSTTALTILSLCGFVAALWLMLVGIHAHSFLAASGWFWTAYLHYRHELSPRFRIDHVR
jgi:hypothetical protein